MDVQTDLNGMQVRSSQRELEAEDDFEELRAACLQDIDQRGAQTKRRIEALAACSTLSSILDA